MLIPSIDLQNGRIVQLVQGESLAIATDDLDAWIARFKRFPKVQLIDLDAAASTCTRSPPIRAQRDRPCSLPSPAARHARTTS